VLRELKSNFAERDASERKIAELKADLASKEQLLSDLETLVRLRDEQKKLLKRAPEIGIELTRPGRRGTFYKRSTARPRAI